MTILNFQQPNRVIMLESTDSLGKFEFHPLEPGFGITIGNAIRRILLSSLEGFAITSIKISGIQHEFSTIPGVIEDVTNIILNLKQVRFKQKIRELDSENINIRIKNQEQFTAADINKYLTIFEVLNPDLLICQMDITTDFTIEININKGRGYVLAEENISENGEIGVIAMDSIFTPIKNVKYEIENFRVEQKTDYEKLTIEILTDGSISPKNALKEAAEILINHFILFSDKGITKKSISVEPERIDEKMLHMRQLLNTKLEDLELSVRSLNCLKLADINTLGQLITYDKYDLLKFRNFGKKSLQELEEFLERMDLSFGMDINKYKLD